LIVRLIPPTHPLRTIRTIVNEVLAALDIEFEALYRGTGRQSIAPERLLRASLLQAFSLSAPNDS
jgi:transposase